MSMLCTCQTATHHMKSVPLVSLYSTMALLGNIIELTNEFWHWQCHCSVLTKSLSLQFLLPVLVKQEERELAGKGRVKYLGIFWAEILLLGLKHLVQRRTS